MGRTLKPAPAMPLQRVAKVHTWLGQLKAYVYGSGDGPDSYAGILVEEIDDALRRALDADENDYLLPVALVGRPYARRNQRPSYAYIPDDDNAA